MRLCRGDRSSLYETKAGQPNERGTQRVRSLADPWSRSRGLLSLQGHTRGKAYRAAGNTHLVAAAALVRQSEMGSWKIAVRRH
jgi:hypothetical protein